MKSSYNTFKLTRPNYNSFSHSKVNSDLYNLKYFNIRVTCYMHSELRLCLRNYRATFDLASINKYFIFFL